MKTAKKNSLRSFQNGSSRLNRKQRNALSAAKCRFREMEDHAFRWARNGAPLWVMAASVAALGSIAAEISKLEGTA